jgi:excisionase family DNA binding protein
MPTLSESRPFISIAEFAAWLGVSQRTAYNMVRRGEVPTVTLSGSLKVPTGALDRWLADREAEALQAVRRNGP